MFEDLSWLIMTVSSFSQLINPKATQICYLLQEAGHQAFIVGGCVRDLHLGLDPKDWDICTNATPQEVIKLFEKTIPTGLKHGTITVCMGEGLEDHFEVTTFRIESEYKDGRRPEGVKFVTSVTEDLARRDLTINAMAYDPVNHNHVDPFGGLQDMDHQIIRAVGDSAARFQEDGLRIMRAARFAARFGYKVESATLKGMKTSLETLKKVSKERISDELRKILMTTRPGYGIVILQDCGALEVVCPIVTQQPIPIWILAMIDRCQENLETRLAFLYHQQSSSAVQQELTQLRLSNQEIKRIIFLLNSLPHFKAFRADTSPLTYRTFIARFKNEAPNPWEYTLQQFIGLAEALDLPVRQLLGKYQGETVFARSELQLNGNDLMQMKIAQGPQFKILLELCYLEILRNPEHNTREYLIGVIKNQLI